MSVNKKVVVLDSAPRMTDRRIIHQLETLAEHSFDVVFVKPSESGFASIEKRDGYRILNLKPPPSEPKIPLSYYFRFQGPDVGDLLLKKQNATRFFPKKLVIVSLLISNLPLLLGTLREKLPKLKRLLGHYFELIFLLCFLRIDIIYRLILYYFGANRNRVTQTYFDDFLEQLSTIKTIDTSNKPSLKKPTATAFLPDLVHVHDLPSLEVGVRLKNKFGAKLIYDSHEIYPDRFTSDKNRFNQELKYERKLISEVDHLISVNDYCLERIQSNHSIKISTTNISNAVKLDSPFLPRKDKLWHKKFNLPLKSSIIVFQGGINHLRSIDPLIESLALLEENIHLGFITYKNDSAFYQTLAKKINVSHRVHFIFEIPWKEVLNYLNSADFGIIPYQVTSENARAATPNKMYEFVSTRLPIIGCRNLPQVEKFITENNVGVVQKFSDPESYAIGIQKALKWKDIHKNKLDVVMSNAAKRYSYEKERNSLIEAYSDLSNAFKKD